MKKQRKHILVAILVVALGLLTASLAFAGQGDANNWAPAVAVGATTESQGVSSGGSITLTHSTSQTPVAGSVACSPDMGATTTENSYWRVYDLNAFGITGDFDVTNVQFGVENATSSGSTTVNIYTLAGPFNTANLTLIGTASFNIADGALFLYNGAVTGTAPAGSMLVVEVSSPDLSGVGAFFIGSNAAGQTDPSYLSSASCGLAQPTDFAAIGFPNIHTIINVSGDEVVAAPAIEVSKDPASQTVVTGGNADFTITVTNTGDVDLLNVNVADALVPACDMAIGALNAGAVNSYACTDVGVAASYTNVVTVTTQLATGGPGPTATASAAVTAVPPTSVSLSGFGSDTASFSPVWLVALLAVVVGFGFAIRRKLTA